VASHADAIVGALRSGRMPCDGAWPADRVQIVQRWIDAGKPARSPAPDRANYSAATPLRPFVGPTMVTGDPVWSGLAGQCWHTVSCSGLPQRLQPGFWDNTGRCCGTAGVLALACDRRPNTRTG
jgi:hypothetical protein